MGANREMMVMIGERSKMAVGNTMPNILTLVLLAALPDVPFLEI